MLLLTLSCGNDSKKDAFGLTFVTIPGGSFRMGSPFEKPVRVVRLDEFEMSAYEITQGQYEAIMGKNPSFKKGYNLPVNTVTRNSAFYFCKRLGEKTGSMYRLPTEAEWEYACRAGTETEFYTGNDMSSDRKISTDLDTAGWYTGNSDRKTHPVGRKEPNAWGLFDMHGNVEEMCSDWYGDYSSIPSHNPKGPSSGIYHVKRGGSSSRSARECRSAYRGRGHPGVNGSTLGFRVVRISGTVPN